MNSLGSFSAGCREEKNKMSWSRERLDQLVQDLGLDVGDECRAQITGLKDLSGEVRPVVVRIEQT